MHKLHATQKRQTTQNTVKQNYPGSVAFYDTWPGNEMGSFYNAPEPTRAKKSANIKTTHTYKNYSVSQCCYMKPRSSLINSRN